MSTPATETHGMNQPRQALDGLTGVTDHDLASTGAGDGAAGHFTRSPWQQPDGDGAAS
jgi:hypothetical protein